MTVADNLALGAYARHSAAGSRETMERQFALFPVLAEQRNQRADTLSGGEPQMVAITRALMGHPKLLLLDEPSLGLSPRLTKELFSTLRTITRGGQSVLLVEQNVHHSLRLADRVHVLLSELRRGPGADDPAVSGALTARVPAAAPWSDDHLPLRSIVTVA